jgi:hypothetical protein
VIRTYVLSLLTALTCCAAHAQSVLLPDCIPIDKAGYVIEEAGLYCLTKDLHTRLDFADHHAENPLVRIRVGNVTIDMRGHRIGRGRLLVQHGGYGFGITTGEPDFEPNTAARIQNVTIRNGTISDFGVGIFSYASRSLMPTLTHAVRKVGVKSFIYDEANIVMENLTFERCDEDIRVEDWVSR